jgi:hypothetical protein
MILPFTAWVICIFGCFLGMVYLLREQTKQFRLIPLLLIEFFAPMVALMVLIGAVAFICDFYGAGKSLEEYKLRVFAICVIYAAFLVACLVSDRRDARLFARFVGSTFFGLVWLILGFGQIYARVGLLPSGKSEPSDLVYDRAVSLYFSVITWTTTGYGDYVPSATGRVYAAAEALLGYTFMGVAISAAFYIISTPGSRRQQ